MRLTLIFIIFAINVAWASPKKTDNPIAKLGWSFGPRIEHILGIATIGTRRDEGFLGESDTEEFLKLSGNIPYKNENILASWSKGKNWWTVFIFDPSGYVKDNERIDPDELLSQIRAADESANERRVGLGLKRLYTIGWYTPPHYDRATNRLEWGIRIQEEGGEENLNYNIRVLGRRGVMHVSLVSDAQSLDSDLRDLKTDLSSFSFDNTEKYAEYRQGDKVAEYGLAALVAGGAAAVAAKKGFFGVMAGLLTAAWKVVAASLAASGKAMIGLVVGLFGWLAALIRRLVGSLLGKRQ